MNDPQTTGSNPQDASQNDQSQQSGQPKSDQTGQTPFNQSAGQVFDDQQSQPAGSHVFPPAEYYAQESNPSVQGSDLPQSQPMPTSAAQPPADPFGSFPPPPPPPSASAGDDDQGSGSSDPNYKFGDINNNFTTTIKIPPHSLTFDEFYFLKLLSGSISLTIDEKKKIVQSVPKLRQEQIDELIRILEEEKSKFIELSLKHGDQLKKLELKHHQEWQDYEMETRSQNKTSEDQAKADEIRKQLGL